MVQRNEVAHTGVRQGLEKLAVLGKAARQTRKR